MLEAAFGIPDEQWGERVHPAIVLKPDMTATEDETIAHCPQLIGGYKLPRSTEFHDQPLPKSGAGSCSNASYASRTGKAANGKSTEPAPARDRSTPAVPGISDPGQYRQQVTAVLAEALHEICQVAEGRTGRR